MVSIEIITQFLDFSLYSNELFRGKSEDIVLEVALFLVLRFLQSLSFFILPLLFLNEVSENMALTRSEIHLRQRCSGVLVP